VNPYYMNTQSVSPASSLGLDTPELEVIEDKQVCYTLAADTEKSNLTPAKMM